MRKIPFYALMAFVVFATSCTNNNTPEVDTSLMQFQKADAVPAAADSADTTNIVNAQPNAESIPAAPAEVYSQAGLNPPHGQPGHDCSIAVGAPLKGSSSQALPVSPVMSSPAPAVPNPGSTVRLNPPHGQPGHNCEIPVGQPLG